MLFHWVCSPRFATFDLPVCLGYKPLRCNLQTCTDSKHSLNDSAVEDLTDIQIFYKQVRVKLFPSVSVFSKLYTGGSTAMSYMTMSIWNHMSIDHSSHHSAVMSLDLGIIHSSMWWHATQPQQFLRTVTDWLQCTLRQEYFTASCACCSFSCAATAELKDMLLSGRAEDPIVQDPLTTAELVDWWLR